MLRSSNEILKITEVAQKLVQNKKSIFTTENESFKFKEEQMSSNNDSLKQSDYLQWEISAKFKQKNLEFESAATSKTLSNERNNTNSNSNVDLDQPFGKVNPPQDSRKQIT